MEQLYYILEGKEPRKATFEEYVNYYRQPNSRRVAEDTVRGAYISTVFLALDHRFMSEGKPILFETMIFGDKKYEDYQERYCTWDEAIEGHKRACEMVVNGESE